MIVISKIFTLIIPYIITSPITRTQSHSLILILRTIHLTILTIHLLTKFTPRLRKPPTTG